MTPLGTRSLGLAALLLTVALAGCLGAPSPAPADGLAPASEGDGHDHTHDAPPAAGGPNQPPVARFDWAPDPGIAGAPILFTDRSTDPDDGIGARLWEFPDGATSQFLRPNHTFAAPGRYLVKLTVSDKGGLTHTAAREVLVIAPGQAPPEARDPGAQVVIALVDTGINPYHEVFRLAQALPPPASFLEGFPADAIPLPITRASTYKAARAADEGLWASVEVGKLYTIPDTRIVGAISFGLGSFGNAAVNSVPILDDDGHGTATASRAAAAGPDVLIVMVESGAQELDEAIAWASNQPWIDVVSVSIGPIANVPAEWPAYKLDALRLATFDAWSQGKLVFAAAGNEPSASVTGHIAGPRWVISVGGALASGRGDPGTSSKAMDIVSDYEPSVAMHDSLDGMEPRPGTSFSAPNAAGAVAQAVHDLRARTGWTRGIEGGKLIPAAGPGLLADGLTNEELRTAMEGVARYWALAEWGPLAGLPIGPAPWVQMGWGYLDGADALPLAEAAWSGTIPAKPDEAHAYMAGVEATRMAMWG